MKHLREIALIKNKSYTISPNQTLERERKREWKQMALIYV